MAGRLIRLGDATSQWFNVLLFNGDPNHSISSDMRIDQRNAGVAVTATSGGVYTVDRWVAIEDTDGTMTVQHDSPGLLTKLLGLPTGKRCGMFPNKRGSRGPWSGLKSRNTLPKAPEIKENRSNVRVWRRHL